MNAPIRLKMTAEQYLAWEQRQEDRYELVSGVPGLMAGGTRAHDEVADNLRDALKSRLKGGPCKVYGIDVRAVSPEGNYRYPDVMVDCGKGGPRDLVAAEPTLAGEVLSPSTEYFDLTDKLAEYQAIASMRHVVVLSQREAKARVWTLWQTGWSQEDVEGLDAIFRLSHFNIEIPLAEIYEGVAFDEA